MSSLTSQRRQKLSERKQINILPLHLQTYLCPSFPFSYLINEEVALHAMLPVPGSYFFLPHLDPELWIIYYVLSITLSLNLLLSTGIFSFTFKYIQASSIQSSSFYSKTSSRKSSSFYTPFPHSSTYGAFNPAIWPMSHHSMKMFSPIYSQL